MVFSRSIVAVAILLGVGVLSCNIWKKNDSEEDIRVFLLGFESSLKLGDEEILKAFEAKQSKESILSAIHVLQNKESEYIECKAGFDQAQVVRDDQGLRVIIPVTFDPRNMEESSQVASMPDEFHKASTFTLWLKPNQRSFVISQLEGDAFYNTFAELRNSMQWDVEREEAMKKRRPIYARAQEIQKQYDSVIWYTTYEDKNYFYVVNGKWVNYFKDLDNARSLAADYKMGLVDEGGAAVIPVEYELIGTLGFIRSSVVEVKKDGKFGYYDLSVRKLIIEPTYDMIIPYETAGAYAIVRADTVYGWVDAQCGYHDGFPSEEAKQWVNTFQFLPKELTLKSENQSLCEIANEESAGYGLVMPPSCYVKTGLFEEIVAGLTTTDMPFGGWTEYVTSNGTLFEKVTDGINALITSITERYVEGREEFYVKNRLVFMSPSNDTLAVSDIRGESVIQLRRIGESLVEIKSRPSDYGYWEGGGGPIEEYDVPIYTYFSLLDSGVVEQKSIRTCSFTQFVKLDSAYIVGNFHYWNQEAQETAESSMLSLSTLQYMRNEILAGYGYRFKDSVDMETFGQYPQNVDNIDELEGQFNEIDQHNLAFLDKVIGLLQPQPL